MALQCFGTFIYMVNNSYQTTIKTDNVFPDKKKAAGLDDKFITLGGVTPHRPPLFLIWNTYLQIIL